MKPSNTLFPWPNNFAQDLLEFMTTLPWVPRDGKQASGRGTAWIELAVAFVIKYRKFPVREGRKSKKFKYASWNLITNTLSEPKLNEITNTFSASVRGLTRWLNVDVVPCPNEFVVLQQIGAPIKLRGLRYSAVIENHEEVIDVIQSCVSPSIHAALSSFAHSRDKDQSKVFGISVREPKILRKAIKLAPSKEEKAISGSLATSCRDISGASTHIPNPDEPLCCINCLRKTGISNCHRFFRSKCRLTVQVPSEKPAILHSLLGQTLACDKCGKTTSKTNKARFLTEYCSIPKDGLNKLSATAKLTQLTKPDGNIVPHQPTSDDSLECKWCGKSTSKSNKKRFFRARCQHPPGSRHVIKTVFGKVYCSKCPASSTICNKTRFSEMMCYPQVTSGSGRASLTKKARYGFKSRLQSEKPNSNSAVKNSGFSPGSSGLFSRPRAPD